MPNQAAVLRTRADPVGQPADHAGLVRERRGGRDHPARELRHDRRAAALATFAAAEGLVGRSAIASDDVLPTLAEGGGERLGQLRRALDAIGDEPENSLLDSRAFVGAERLHQRTNALADALEALLNFLERAQPRTALGQLAAEPIHL